MVITMALALKRAVRLALAHRSLTAACFVTVMFCLLTRVFGEVDAPYPFAIGTYLLFVIASYSADYANAERSACSKTVSLIRRLAVGMRPAESQNPGA